MRRCIEEGLVGGEGFAVDASLIRADANRQRSAEGTEPVDWKAMAETRRSVQEYLDTLDDAAWGAASEVKPKFVSRSDPAAQWTGALKGHAFFAYATNYLIDMDHAVIVDVEASRAIRQAEVGAARTMIERTQERFGLWPERLAGGRMPRSRDEKGRDRWELQLKQLPKHRHEILRSIHEGARDMARDIATTDAYVTSRRERKKVEMLFAHLKRILKLDRLRLRGPNGARDEFHLAAAAQNLRKLAKLIPMPMPKPARGGRASARHLIARPASMLQPTSSTVSAKCGPPSTSYSRRPILATQLGGSGL